MQDESMVHSKTEDDQLSNLVGLKSIRTEKHEPIFRAQATYAANDEDFARQDSCLSNCRRMLCDRSRTPNQLDIYEAYRAPNIMDSFDKRKGTPRFV